MNCPKCGMKNQEGEKICDFCGHELAEGNSKEKKSKFILIHTIGFLSTLFAILFFINLDTLGSLLAAGIILSYIWASIRSIKKSKVRQLVKIIFIFVNITQNLLMTSVFLWSLDASPIPNDYTVADLRSAPSDYDITHELLYSLKDSDGADWPKEKFDMQNELAKQLFAKALEAIPGFTKTPEDISEEEDALAKDIKKLIQGDILNFKERSELTTLMAEDIRRLWKSSEAHRSIISRLNEYEQIADLTEPDLENLPPFFNMLRDLARIHFLYALLACEQDDIDNMVNSLIEFDSAIRKYSINARVFIGKLVCYSILNFNIRTANFIINHPKTNNEIVLLLADHFATIGDELSCLRNPCIFQYLVFKHIMKHDWEQHLGPGRIKHMILVFKPNSTLRVFRNYLDDQPQSVAKTVKSTEKQREELTVWPDLYPDFGPVKPDPNGDFPQYYEYYNMMGALIIKMFIPAWERTGELRTKLHVHDDLFQIVINARLGRKIDLSARAFSDNYIVDLEKQMIYSPGLDRKPFTEDDITLSINPDVIKF